MEVQVFNNGISTLELLNSNYDLKLLLEFIKPNNTFLFQKIAPFTKQKFQFIWDIIKFYQDGNVIEIIKLLTQKTENEILISNSQEFISFVKWINNEIEIIFKLNNMLSSQNLDKNDIAFQNAGADKLNRYNENMVYYSIDKNPTSWIAIGELPFEIVFTKQMIDKDMADINKQYLINIK